MTARRVNPAIFPKNLVINSKTLPTSNHKCDYQLCLEEAAYDLIHNQDADYLKRLIDDLIKKDMEINKFNTLDLESEYKGIYYKAHMSINRNKPIVKIMLPMYSFNFKITLDGITAKSDYYHCAIETFKAKTKGVYRALLELSECYEIAE